MKKLLGLLTLLVMLGASGFFVHATLDYPLREGRTILTQDQSDVVGSSITDSQDPLRDGAGSIAEGIGDAAGSERIFYDEIDSTAEAWTEITRAWTGILNRALGIAGLVVLVYLIYHGFLVATAAGDEEKIKKGWAGVRTAMIALLGIALAWFIVSVVFWLINLLVQ